MLDVDPLLIAEVERFAAALAPEPNWAGVLERAGTIRPDSSRRRRYFVLAAAVAGAAVLVVAVAAAAGFGDFSTWLTGQPGKPAATSEQRAFDKATRSWQGFPRTATLRRLVEARVSGSTYILYGFRGAGSFCLRLAVAGKLSATQLACAPLSELRARTSPALVLVSDFGLGSANRLATNGPLAIPLPAASVSFGVVADGVDGIHVQHQVPAATRSFVSGNAFLSVSYKLSPFNPTTRVTASVGARRVPVPLALRSGPLGSPPATPQPAARGPAHVQRAVQGGAISWLAQRRRVGAAVPATIHHIVGVLPGVLFARLVTPDPTQPERIVVSIRPAGTIYFHGRLRNDRQVCAELVGGRYQGGGCWPAGRLFSTAPFAWGVDQQSGGQIVTLAGLAADQVARLTLYTATGRIARVPLHDNAYETVASLADYPLRLVAYDRSGRIIGVKTFNAQHAPPLVGPAPNARWRKVLTTSAGSVYTVASTIGGTCVGFRYAGGSAAIGCDQPIGDDMLAIGTGTDESGTYVSGLTGRDIARVQITLRTGVVRSINTPNGYLIVRFPAAAMVAEITVFDRAGRAVAHDRFPCGSC